MSATTSATTSAVHPYDPRSIAGKPLHVEEQVELLVVGGGPAGLSAAITAARAGLSVVLVDENPVAFATMGEEVPLHYGQAMSGLVHNRTAMVEAIVASEPLIEAAFEAGVDIRLSTACWGLFTNGPAVGWLPGTVAGLGEDERCWMLQAQAVIVASGRRDMGLGFPGWDKPGVMGATAALALARRYGALEPRRVVVLGATSDALQTVRALRACGVDIAAVIERAPAPPAPETELEELRAAGVPVLAGHVVREAFGTDAVAGVEVEPVDARGRAAGPRRRIDCDGVVLAVGATPMIDLLDACGCAVAFQSERGGFAPIINADQGTSNPAIFAAGDCAGVWPGKSRDRGIAEAEGRRAALTIAARRGLADAGAMSPASPPDVPACDLSDYRLAWVRASIVEADRAVHVCQCEEVTAREILEVRPPRYLGWPDDTRNDRSLSALLGAGVPDPDQVKRLTRAGMGPCQGRRCREQVAALLALEAGAPLSAIPLAHYRAPVRPLPLAFAGRIPEPPEQAAQWDSWFGMHAQTRPFWQLPARYMVRTNDVTGTPTGD
ncbi:FAD-dependent oxidoreductase [Ancylobacter moscoviensis]